MGSLVSVREVVESSDLNRLCAMAKACLLGTSLALRSRAAAAACVLRDAIVCLCVCDNREYRHP